MKEGRVFMRGKGDVSREGSSPQTKSPDGFNAATRTGRFVAREDLGIQEKSSQEKHCNYSDKGSPRFCEK